MFTQAWFWISLSAFFFNSNFNYYKSKGLLNGSNITRQDAIAGISNLGLLVFWIIGLFVADSWWQPIVAFGISMVGGSVLGIVLDGILPRSVAYTIAAISPFISFALLLIAYLVWY
jgi:hypothetical protein